MVAPASPERLLCQVQDTFRFLEQSSIGICHVTLGKVSQCNMLAEFRVCEQLSVEPDVGPSTLRDTRDERLQPSHVLLKVRAQGVQMCGYRPRFCSLVPPGIQRKREENAGHDDQPVNEGPTQTCLSITHELIPIVGDYGER